MTKLITSDFRKFSSQLCSYVQTYQETGISLTREKYRRAAILACERSIDEAHKIRNQLLQGESGHEAHSNQV